MVQKRVLSPGRLRRVPKQFSWVDHRLVRHRHICGCTHAALALYLLLVTVADAEGLSYYSDETIRTLLNMDQGTLCQARGDLCRRGLIAHQRPLYQVLSLDDPHAGHPVRPKRIPRNSSGEAVSIAEVLRQAAGGAR
jgi:hypothetical protein